MEIDYESDYSSLSSAQNSTAEESNMEDNEFNTDEIEDEQDFKYTIPFEKTETKRKRMAIKIGKETFVFKLTTLGDLGCINNQTHMHDCLSGVEYKFKSRKIGNGFWKASINAFKFHFPGIKVFGCQFHFAQFIRRKVDTLGLKIPYASNDGIQFFIKSFIALSMVPLSKIDDGFIIILENKSKLFVKLTTTTNNLLIVNANRGCGRRGRGRGVIGNTEPNSLTVVFQDLTLNIVTIGNDYCKLIENFIIK
ncbi:unnamed protein product [Brachionus calyciflorus]|uniref:Uncharacterized protein n=1 Tax=Brachionus calyciflorus TaxID=104777 RepID=A0A814M2S4_9BILA|nr:unnamed protein product [Brachionus calyciflorus]